MQPLEGSPFLLTRIAEALFPAHRALRGLRARWGKPADADGWYASRYFDLLRRADDPDAVDDQTWTDLEFPELFSRMDSTVSPVGGQVLLRQLRQRTVEADALAERYAGYLRLQSDATLRETLQRRLLPLADDRHARIADFLFGPLPPPLPHRRLLHAWALASLAVLAASLAWPWLAWAWFAMVLVNAFTLARVGMTGRTLRDVQTLQACLQLAKVANGLGVLHARCPELRPLAKLHAERPRRARLAKALGGYLVWTAWSKVFPISIIVLALNLAFLVDLVLYARAMRRFAKLREMLAPSFELVGAVDAALAVASWLQYCRHHCRPALTDTPVLDVRDGRHPLLPEGVPNSVHLDGRSALVTGSNMAGKTTFIKMVGANVLLAQTLGFCSASAASIPCASVRASIHTPHSIASGKSRYFSEAEAIRGFFAAAPGGRRTLLIIDELFSGTNTLERVAIARAVLEALCQHATVLATTHDVELQAFLGGRFDLYHFQEDPEVDGFFDYHLRTGPATARNAIRLLREMRFPDAIVAKALAYAEPEPQPAVSAVGADGDGSPDPVSGARRGTGAMPLQER